MHMSDALISPAVGGTLWAVTAGVTGWSARELTRTPSERRVPLMGVLGAFVFAAQMVNFTIPGTGSSGHLGGGMLLAILLGPHAAFLVMASVLTVQALLFADGGLLALGCNVVNLSFFTSFLVYPLVFRPIAGLDPSRPRLYVAAILAAILGLQLGAFGVVLETTASGISELPFGAFALLMQPIHLAIGVVEGLVTASAVGLVWQARPEILSDLAKSNPRSLRPVLVGLALMAILTGGVLSWFASQNPDGLEWSAAHASGQEALAARPAGFHGWFARIQTATSLMPDYDFQKTENAAEAPKGWPAIKAGTSLSGLLGSAIVLALVLGTGLLLRLSRRPRVAPEDAP